MKRRNNKIQLIFYGIFVLSGLFTIMTFLSTTSTMRKMGANIEGMWMFDLIPIFIGSTFILVGGIPIVRAFIGDNKKKKLLQKGKVLLATVENVDWNTSYSVNGRNPYVIYCYYKDEYKDIIYRFKSENLWTDPFNTFPPGSEIEVYVDENDYSNYYVNPEKVGGQKIIDYT